MKKLDPSARENFVYSMLDAGGRILYVGVTRNLDSRWQGHSHSNPGLVSATARCRLRGPYTRPTARAIERAAILAENPLFNLEVDRAHKHEIVSRLNDAARSAARDAVLSRYGFEGIA